MRDIPGTKLLRLISGTRLFLPLFSLFPFFFFFFFFFFILMFYLGYGFFFSHFFFFSFFFFFFFFFLDRKKKKMEIGREKKRSIFFGRVSLNCLSVSRSRREVFERGRVLRVEILMRFALNGKRFNRERGRSHL